MTFRCPNRKTELEGIRYIQGIVQNSNSIFQAIDLENDQGNDCCIEFVRLWEANACAGERNVVLIIPYSCKLYKKQAKCHTSLSRSDSNGKMWLVKLSFYV